MGSGLYTAGYAVLQMMKLMQSSLCILLLLVDQVSSHVLMKP